MTDHPELESVRILRLQPGDVLIVRLAEQPNKGVAEDVKAHVEERFPEHEVLVLGPNVDLEIVRSDDALCTYCGEPEDAAGHAIHNFRPAT